MYFRFLKKFITFLIFITLSQKSFSQTNQPPQIVATGDQIYCPLTPLNIVSTFNIIDPDDTTISALSIQISTGYVKGEDLLKLTGTHPNINYSWSISEGKITLTGSSGDANYIDLIAAVKDIIFESNSVSPTIDKYFSFTIGDANYLPSTTHYYEYISDIGISWQNAKTTAEARTYFGLQGYLATITSAEESQLVGKQATGSGWIGGSDQETEGTWKWVTGPEGLNGGTIFWNGLANGSSPTNVYTNWNSGEPNNLGNEDYAHVISDINVGQIGSWNDLINNYTKSDSYQPKGYVVEYGGMPGDPIVNISASTKIAMTTISSTTGASRCGSGSVTLSATATKSDVLWFDSETSNTPIFTGTNYTIPVLTNTTTYYVLASDLGCLTGKRTPVIATINPLPIINSTLTLKNCDEDGNPDGNTDFNLKQATDLITNNNSNLSVNYYLSFAEANTATTTPINPISFNNSTSNTVFARVENGFGCYQIATITLDVSVTSFPIGFKYEISNCENDDSSDGISIFDLTEATQFFLSKLPPGNLSVHYFRTNSDALLEQNEILPPNNYTNENPFLQSIFVRVENNDDGACFGIGEHLTLITIPRPDFKLETSSIFCLGTSPILVEISKPTGVFNYKWANETGTIISTKASAVINNGGIYTVVATSTIGCTSFAKTINISESNSPTITLNDITIVDDSDNNSITINNQNNNLGIGNYEFNLDNGNYQDEPIFENISAGIHTVYIRDKNGCGLTSIQISIIGFPKFFTPNNDGINDTWNIAGLSSDFYTSIHIYIFDRFGKIITKLDSKNTGWNGFMNGVHLPSSDYWFSAEFIDQFGNLRIKKGHFSLIRSSS